MEFGFSCTKVLNADANGLAILSSNQRPRVNFSLVTNSTLRHPSNGLNVYQSDNSNPIDQIIDLMGIASSKAQRLATVITSASKFFSTGDNTMYVKCQGNKVIGFLKTGTRNLF